MKYFRYIILFAAFTVFVGCGTDTNPGTYPLLPDEHERREAMVELTHAATTHPEAMLSGVRALDVDSQDRMYVADGQNHRIAVFDPDGALLYTVGQEGAGPGEFLYLGTIQIIEADSLMAFDLQNRRLSVFEPGSGEIAYSTRIDPGDGLFMNWIRRKQTNDGYLATNSSGFSTPDDDDTDRNTYLHHLTLSGELLADSLLALPAAEMLVHMEEEGLYISNHPFGRRSVYTVGPGNTLYHAWTDTFGVHIYTIEGEPVRQLKFGYKGPDVTRTDVQAAMDNWSDDWRRMMRPLLEASIPDTWPAMRDLRVDDRGHIWISVGKKANDPHEWAVFTNEGEYLASVYLKEGQNLLVVRGHRLYISETDDIDGPRVVVYQAAGLQSEIVAAGEDQ